MNFPRQFNETAENPLETAENPRETALGKPPFSIQQIIE
jgi:hypothetical protein